MYCNKCGNELKDVDIFCSKCGANIKNVSAVPPSNTITDGESKKEKKKLKITKVGPGILLILIIAVMGFMIESTTNRNSKEYSELSSIGMTYEQINETFEIIRACGYTSFSLSKDASLDDLDGKRYNWLSNKR